MKYRARPNVKSKPAIEGATENAIPDIARPDNAAPYRKGGHRGTRLKRSQRVELEYLSAQEKNERAER